MPDNTNQKLTSDVNPAKPLPFNLDVLIVNMDKVLFENQAQSIIVPTAYGNLAILPGHTPIFMKLTKGQVMVKTPDGSISQFDIHNGVAKATQYKITILVGYDDPGEEPKETVQAPAPNNK